MRLPASLAVLSHPPFRRYFVGYSVSELGTSMTAVALPFAVFAIGGNVADLGLVLGAALLPKISLVLIGGAVGDRFERRTVLCVADIGMAVCQCGTAIVLLAHADVLWQLLVLQVLFGCFSALSLPATTGVVPDIVAGGALQQANSLVGIATGALSVAGPAVAGVLVAFAGPGWALICDAMSFGLSALAMAGLPAVAHAGPAGRATSQQPSQVGDRTERTSMRHQIASGWTAFTSQAWIPAMVVSFAIYQASVLPAIYAIGPQEIRHGFGPVGWAAILAARSIGAIVIGIPLLRWRPRRPVRLAVLFLLLDVPFLVALATDGGFVVLVISASGSAAGLNAADTLWETSLQENVPASSLARVSSYDWMGSLAFAPLGYLAVGSAANAFGIRITLLSIVSFHAVIHLTMPFFSAISRISRPGPNGYDRSEAVA